MVSLRVCKLGKTSIHIFIPDAKVNSAYYCNKVFSHLLPKTEQLSNGDLYLPTRWSLPTHTKT